MQSNVQKIWTPPQKPEDDALKLECLKLSLEMKPHNVDQAVSIAKGFYVWFRPEPK